MQRPGMSMGQASYGQPMMTSSPAMMSQSRVVSATPWMPVGGCPAGSAAPTAFSPAMMSGQMYKSPLTSAAFGQPTTLNLGMQSQLGARPMQFPQTMGMGQTAGLPSTQFSQSFPGQQVPAGQTFVGQMPRQSFGAMPATSQFASQMPATSQFASQMPATSQFASQMPATSQFPGQMPATATSFGASPQFGASSFGAQPQQFATQPQQFATQPPPQFAGQQAQFQAPPPQFSGQQGFPPQYEEQQYMMSPTVAGGPEPSFEEMVQMEVIQPGRDNVAPRDGQTAVVHYIGTFPDGRKFDSSRDHGQPFTFQLGAGQAIRGYEEAAKRMSKGMRARFTIQPEWCYGAAGAPPDIPPNQVLVFDIEMLDFY